MREKVIEQRLIKAVRHSGGLAMKFVSPNLNGVPDRLLLFPGGKLAFAEVKAPGEKPRPLQVHRIARLRELGFRVYVIDNVSDIEPLVRSMSETDVGEPPTTAGGRNLVGGEVIRNKRSPQWGAALIEDADADRGCNP